MKKTLLLSLLLTGPAAASFAQVRWSEDSIPFSQVEWNNYSTTYLGDVRDTTPLLITAIPYNGIYDLVDGGSGNTPLDLSFTGSSFRFRSELSDNVDKLTAYDSSEVYFLAPGIFPGNAAQYEFRVLLNATTVIKPWSDIRQFTEGDFTINSFKKGFAFLGGYTAPWDNYLLVSVRKKGTDKAISTTVVYWQQVKPRLLDIFTPNELSEFLQHLRNSYDLSMSKSEIQKWQQRYPPDQIDKHTSLPRKLILQPNEDNLIFFLAAKIYKKEALEYSLVKDGDIVIDWKANDFDNNFIWLKRLTPGNYELQMRFAKQRHNVSTYPFEIKPAWHQTAFFRTLAACLLVFLLGIIFLLFRLRLSRQLLAAEQLRKEKTAAELISIRSQLNPHFVFNALNSIQGLINKRDFANANLYLTEFSSLLRESLKNNEKEFVPLSIELKILETYIRLEQLRFNFHYTISVTPDLNTDTIEMPSLFLQPLVENAIKHGISVLQEKGEIDISFSSSGKDLLVKIGDNGKGFDTTLPTAGFGLKLTKERIALLRQSLKDQPVSLSIDSGASTEAIDEPANGLAKEPSIRNGTSIYIKFENWL